MSEFTRNQWKQMASSYRSFIEGVAMLQQDHNSELNQLLHENLHSPASAVFGVEVLRHMSITARVRFVSDLLGLASYSNQTTRDAQMILLSLDSDWLRKNIIAEMKPLLVSEESFNAFFQLATRVHFSCAQAILQLAQESVDPEVKSLIPYMEDELRGTP